MKTKRNLSGIYFRHQICDASGVPIKDGKWDNVCFEDLPLEKQQELIGKMDDRYKTSMIITLANTINKIGDELDIITS